MLSELQARINVDEWWASERPRIAVLFPQRCDEVIAQTTVAMQRAKDEGHAQILADAAAMCARAYTGQGEAENGARLIHEMLSGAEHQFTKIERAPLIAALGVAYECWTNTARRLTCCTTAADAQALCERLREAVAATPVMLARAAHRVTISIGVTTYVPPESTHDALSRADMRVYGAKTAGRNRVIAG